MAIRVQMPNGVTSVSVAGQHYDVPEDGIVALESPEHVGPLVAAGGIELGEDGSPGRTSRLAGTSTLPPTVEILPGQEPRLIGSIVADTHARSGVSADEWNNLPQHIRDTLINLHVGTLRGEIGDVAAERQRADEAIAERDALRDQLQALQSGGTSEGGKPDFERMTKAQINEWITDNGGTELTAGNHNAFVAAAEAHWAELHAEPDAD